MEGDAGGKDNNNTADPQSNSNPASAGDDNQTVKRCSECQTTKTPCWRRGATPKTILCNACGLKSARKRRHAEKGGSNKKKEKDGGKEGNKESQNNDGATRSKKRTRKHGDQGVKQELLEDLQPESRYERLSALGSILSHSRLSSLVSESALRLPGPSTGERSWLDELREDLEENSGENGSGPRDFMALLARAHHSGDRPRGSPWNADTELYLFNRWKKHMDIYKHHVWPLSPVNPDVFNHDALAYLCCTAEGREERSPLSLTLQFCLAIGAMLEGDFDQHWQHWNQSKQHLEYLFDCTDYSVALVLIAMSHHVLFWESDFFKSSYYETLALNIIKVLGAYHSDAYHRCLCMHSLSFSMEKTPDLNKMVQLKMELTKAKQYPYYSLTKGTFVKNSVSAHSLNRIRLVTSAVGILTNVVAGINLFRGNGGRLYDADVIFPHLIMALDQLEVEIKQLIRQEGDELLAPTVLLTPVMFITALRAECYWCLGDRNMAIAWGTRFCNNAKHPCFRYIIAGIVMMLQFVLEILHDGKQYQVLGEMLDLIQYHAEMCDGVNKLRTLYKGALDQALRPPSDRDFGGGGGNGDNNNNDNDNNDNNSDYTDKGPQQNPAGHNTTNTHQREMSESYRAWAASYHQRYKSPIYLAPVWPLSSLAGGPSVLGDKVLDEPGYHPALDEIQERIVAIEKPHIYKHDINQVSPPSYLYPPPSPVLQEMSPSLQEQFLSKQSAFYKLGEEIEEGPADSSSEEEAVTRRIFLFYERHHQSRLPSAMCEESLRPATVSVTPPQAVLVDEDPSLVPGLESFEDLPSLCNLPNTASPSPFTGSTPASAVSEKDDMVPPSPPNYSRWDADDPRVASGGSSDEEQMEDDEFGDKAPIAAESMQPSYYAAQDWEDSVFDF